MPSIFDTLTLTCRRLTLANNSTQVHIGAYDCEHGHTQPVIFDIDVWIPLASSTGFDLEEVYDYTCIAAAVEEVIARGHIELQETLADEILSILMRDNRVKAVRIRTKKTLACEKAEAIAVETFRLRASS